MNPAHLIRSLARSPGFSLAVAGMLAVGTTALATTFGIADAALFREPPFDHAEKLVSLNMTRAAPGEEAKKERFSWPRLRLLQQHAKSFESIANHSPTTLTLIDVGGAMSATGEVVGVSYFSMLRQKPAMGRFFLPDEDDAEGAHAVVVLGHDMWRDQFASDSQAIGRTFRANGATLTIIGVAAPGFRGLSDRAQFWIPTTMAPATSYNQYLTTNQNFISVTARLKPGVSVAEARAELGVLGSRIDAAAPSQQQQGRTDVMSATATLLNEARGDAVTRRSILVLLAAVALLHLLACANAANLLLSRAASRRREAAVRAALGAGSTRLFIFLVREGVVLAIVGGIVGLVAAALISRVITIPTDLWRASGGRGALGTFDTPSFGMRGALFGVVVTAITAMIVGLIPALSALRSDLAGSLRAGARGMSEGSGTLRRPSLRGAVVALEAALAVVLLVGGGLMISSFARMRSTDLGVESSHVLTFLLRPSEVRIPPDAAPAHIARVLAAITSVPGVESATVDGGAPVSGSARGTVHFVGKPVVPNADAPPVNRHYVGPDHFRTLGMRVLTGRAFTDGDIAGRQKVTIASESAARKFWPGEDPIGKRVWFGTSGTWGNADSSAVVVGVVNDIATNALDQEQNRNEFYTPYAQFTYAWRYYFVRTTGDPTTMVAQIRKAVASIEPDVPLTEVKTLGDLIGSSWARHRFDAWLFGTFSVLAILLASAGIYAVVAYSVSMRTREMGIRLALGAQPTSIIGLVLLEGMTWPLTGLVAGVGLAVAATQILRASLYGVTPTDPFVFGGSVALLALVAGVACVVPARRATRVDPLEALRAE